VNPRPGRTWVFEPRLRAKWQLVPDDEMKEGPGVFHTVDPEEATAGGEGG
jgi:hypothetical protein